MTEPGPTRRELVGVAAAASLLGSATGVAAARAATPTVFSDAIGRLVGTSPERGSRWPFVLAGVQWAEPVAARIELRARRRHGGWSRWAIASTLGHEPDGRARPGVLFGEPIWFGASDRFQVRASEPVHGLQVHFISGLAMASASAASAYPLAQPTLDAGPGQPRIIARSAWAGDHAPPAVPPGYGKVRLAFVHHTDNPNGYSAGAVPAMLLAMYQFHRFVRGWHDIGYNFVIDAFGRTWEAREGGIDEAVVGAQAGGYNLESTGVAILGTFSSAVPPAAAIEALEQLLAWKLSLHGIPALGHVRVEVNPSDAFYTPFAPGAHVSLPRVAGHRDGCTTDCPGNAFYARLPSIRPRVAALAGAVANVTMGGPAAPLALSNLTAIAGVPFVVSGRLTTLVGGPSTGVPIAGAPIEVQTLEAGSVVTVASAVSAGDGSWQASVSLVHDALVRALHRPSPATTSDLVSVGVAPAISVSLESRSPLRTTGTVFPHKRHVIVSLYAIHGQHRRRVATDRVVVRDGRFAARLKPPGRGSYVLLAHTEADALNIAGSSAPVAFRR